MNAEVRIETEWEKPANRMIFGHFIEFMRDCIDEGMWAQLLKNRGFDRRKEIPDGVVDGNPNVADGWIRTGYKNTFEIYLDRMESLAKDGYAQKIVCSNAYDGYVGIAQTSLHLEPGTYCGYIWMKAKDQAHVLVRMCEEDGGVFKEQEFEVCPGWHKYEFSVTVKEKTTNGMLEFCLLGEGTLWLDGASLMPEDAIGGIWKEVISHIRELKPPVIRFPGGCFADCYHWLDGIGARDTRPSRRNLHWGGWEDNSFGTDEYLEFCELVGCEPMICVNFGSGSAQEAADWVEYCNGDVTTKYGRLRAENGHPSPWNVRYWDVGNETFGAWEIGHCEAWEYAEKYLEFYRAMKAKDENLLVMACGGDGDSYSQEWNRILAKMIGENADALCLHMYTLKQMEGKTFSNDAVYYAVVGSPEKYAKILQDSWETMRKENNRIRLAVTEYNLGTVIDSYREQTLEAAIFVGGMLNLFLRNSEKLSMCNISDLVNGWPGGIIVSRYGHAYGTASYYVLKLYSESRIAGILDASLSGETYMTEVQIGNIEPLSDVPYADVIVCRNEDGEIVLFVVNRSLEEQLYLKLPYIEFTAEVTELWAEKTSDMNRPGQMCILPRTYSDWAGDGTVSLKPHSVNRIVIKGNRLKK